MTPTERIREALLAPPGPDYFRQRAVDGWRPVAIIWERDIVDPAVATTRPAEEIPYGLQVGADCSTLEENAAEKQVILKLIDGIVEDKRISQIAMELNGAGFRTRAGNPWSASAVFELLPRVVEVGPRVFPTAEWAERRAQLVGKM